MSPSSASFVAKNDTSKITTGKKHFVIARNSSMELDTLVSAMNPTDPTNCFFNKFSHE